MCVAIQALAGPGLPDHLHHGAAGHAEAEGGVLAVPAQLPSGHGLLLRGPGARPSPPENHLPQGSGAGGATHSFSTHPSLHLLFLSDSLCLFGL